MRRWRSSAMRRLAVTALLLLAAAAGSVRAEQPGGAPRPFSAEGLAKVSDYVRNEVATGKIPGAILLIQQHGKPVYFENFGVRDIATELAMSAERFSRFYSMSKPITSVAAMMLVEDGKLKLDDPVSKYIPAFADMKVGVEQRSPGGIAALHLVAAEHPITIRDLMRQTSGITYGFFGDGLVKKAYADARLLSGDMDNAAFAARVAA